MDEQYCRQDVNLEVLNANMVYLCKTTDEHNALDKNQDSIFECFGIGKNKKLIQNKFFSINPFFRNRASNR